MGITIKEIARITGTSLTAVSFVLNGKDSGAVSAPKKDLILKAIEKYGYKQNNLARGLQAKRTFHIAICVRGFFDEYPLLGNFSTHEAISRMMRRFTERGYSAEWLQIDARASARDTVKVLTSASVDGFLFVKWEREQIEKIVPTLSKKGIRAVCLNTSLDSKVIPWCGYSLAKAAEAGTQYLIDAGRKKIALLDYLAGEHAPHRDGYLKAMRRNRLKPLVHVESPERRVDNVARIARELIDAHPDIDGILSTENFYSMFVSQVIRGKDILLVSIGDTCFAELQQPKMVHLSLPMRAMADWCAQTLVDRIEAREPLPATHKIFDCDLIDK
ncbi:MAG TPA: LacI family DNA-binding transcriptional regulator [Planctomycetota bacterium]|nr:LacI family DNA-binding transcriptional regulator [Planctomycetota bacterium]